MVNVNPTPTEVEDDPRFPWKAVAAAIVPILTWLVTDQAFDLPSSVVAVLTIIIGFLGTYVTPNPKRVKRT